MRNHGAVSSAQSITEAVEHACLTEWVCDVYLAARSLGTPALLTDSDLEAVAQQSRRLSYGH
jgi:L-fuculose-phosphate aldolase